MGLDGRLDVTANLAKRRGGQLTLEAYVEGVVDGAEAANLAARTSAMMIRQ